MDILIFKHIWIFTLISFVLSSDNLKDDYSLIESNYGNFKRKSFRDFLEPYLIDKKFSLENKTFNENFINFLPDNSETKIYSPFFINPTRSISSNVLLETNNFDSQNKEKVDFNNVFSNLMHKAAATAYAELILRNKNSNQEYQYLNQFLHLNTNEHPFQKKHGEVLGCYRKIYKFKAVNKDELGFKCWQNIKILSCGGRCDTGQYPDWRRPYKKSDHSVCLHKKIRKKKISLKFCDKGVNETLRIYSYVEAESCSCSICNSTYVSCEPLVESPFII